MKRNDDLKGLARFLDSKFQLPGGLRIGWDGILGFIPGLGDVVTNTLSMYIIARAAALGCPPSVIIRMGGNVLLDNLFDLVPVLGNFFDIFWKSNLRNIELVEKFQASPERTTIASRILVVAAVIFVFAVLIGSVILIGFTAFWVFEQLRTMVLENLYSQSVACHLTRIAPGPAVT